MLELLIFNQEIPIPVPFSKKVQSLNFKLKFAYRIFYLSGNPETNYHHKFWTRFRLTSDEHSYETSSST